MNPSSSSGIYSSANDPGATPPASMPSGVPFNGGRRPSNTNKKGLFAAVFVVVALAIAVIAVVVVMSASNNGNNSGNTANNSESNNENQNETPTTTNDTNSEYKYNGQDAEFYQYANYVLYGDKNVKKGLDLGEYTADKEYSIAKAIKDNNVEFMNTAVSLWKGFVSKMGDITENDTLKTVVATQNTMMDFLEKYAGMKTRSEEDMWKLYFEVGAESAINTVKADYTLLAGSTYEKGANWAKAKAKEAEAALKLFAKYNVEGCYKNDDFDQDCINKNIESFEDVMQGYLDAEGELNATGVKLGDIADDLAKNCFEIRNELAKMRAANAENEKTDNKEAEDKSGENKNAENKDAEDKSSTEKVKEGDA